VSSNFIVMIYLSITVKLLHADVINQCKIRIVLIEICLCLFSRLD